MKRFYHLWYRFGKVPWEIGPREELVQIVKSGRIRLCRVIDLGSGTATNTQPNTEFEGGGDVQDPKHHRWAGNSMGDPPRHLQFRQL